MATTLADVKYAVMNILQLEEQARLYYSPAVPLAPTTRRPRRPDCRDVRRRG
jgi:hypothetical protein